ncbi:MAG: hypothetical protein U0793_04880 [Gemmataceae bacterium]
MSGPGQSGAAGESLIWSERLLTWEDLRSRLHGLRELVLGPKTLVSPLLLDELRERKIAVRRDVASTASKTENRGALGVAQRTSDGTVGGAIEALKREGLALAAWEPKGANAAAWAWSLGHLVKEAGRGVAFATDAALVACVAGKVAGVRPAHAMNARQAARAIQRFAANLLTIETPGPTFFEVKQILRTAATTAPQSSDYIERVFKELDGHAHR